MNFGSGRRELNRSKDVSDLLTFTIRNLDEDLDKSITSASYISGDPTRLEFQLEFFEPENISPDVRDLDQLDVTFLDLRYFIDAETGL